MPSFASGILQIWLVDLHDMLGALKTLPVIVAVS